MIYLLRKDGVLVNRIAAAESFVQSYAAQQGLEYELEQLPPQNPPTPTEQEDISAMVVDHEYRLTLMELGVN